MLRVIVMLAICALTGCAAYAPPDAVPDEVFGDAGYRITVDHMEPTFHLDRFERWLAAHDERGAWVALHDERIFRDLLDDPIAWPGSEPSFRVKDVAYQLLKPPASPYLTLGSSYKDRDAIIASRRVAAALRYDTLAR